METSCWQNRIVGCFDAFPIKLLHCKKTIMVPLGPIHIYVLCFQLLFSYVLFVLLTLIFPYIISSSVKDSNLKNLKVFQNLINKFRILLKEINSDSKPQVKYVPPSKWQCKNIDYSLHLLHTLGCFCNQLEFVAKCNDRTCSKIWASERKNIQDLWHLLVPCFDPYFKHVTGGGGGANTTWDAGMPHVFMNSWAYHITIFDFE